MIFKGFDLVVLEILDVANTVDSVHSIKYVPVLQAVCEYDDDFVIGR